MRLTALVEHILAQREGFMSEIIAEELDISRVGPANAQPLHCQYFACQMDCGNNGPLRSPASYFFCVAIYQDTPVIAGTCHGAYPIWQRSLVPCAASCV